MEYTIIDKRKLYFGAKVTPSAYYDVNLTGEELFRFDKPRTRVRLQCMQGVLWVSQSGCPEDYLLKAGESFISNPGRFVLAQAVKNGSMRVSLLD